MVIFKNEKITPKQCFKSRGFYNKMIKLSRLLGKDKENATQKAEWNCSYRISSWGKIS